MVWTSAISSSSSVEGEGLGCLLGSDRMTSVGFNGLHEVVFLLRFGRDDFFASEIFKNIVRLSHPLKLTLPTDEVGLAFELAVIFDFVHLGVSHVWVWVWVWGLGLESVFTDYLS